MAAPLDAAWAATFSRLVPSEGHCITSLAKPRTAPKPPRNLPRGRTARLHLDAAIERLRACLKDARENALLVATDPDDVEVVLAAIECYRPALRPARLENLVTLGTAINPKSKVEIPAALCPDDNTNMRCLETRRPEPGMVRRRWECYRCKKRFTSYTHEKE